MVPTAMRTGTSPRPWRLATLNGWASSSSFPGCPRSSSRSALVTTLGIGSWRIARGGTSAARVNFQMHGQSKRLPSQHWSEPSMSRGQRWAARRRRTLFSATPPVPSSPTASPCYMAVSLRGRLPRLRRRAPGNNSRWRRLRCLRFAPRASSAQTPVGTLCRPSRLGPSILARSSPSHTASTCSRRCPVSPTAAAAAASLARQGPVATGALSSSRGPSCSCRCWCCLENRTPTRRSRAWTSGTAAPAAMPRARTAWLEAIPFSRPARQRHGH
mmetsp:Transcript_141417/g.452024  ORF Transcript_141417/g.452024 Transcript_141417/m.452024 type:complete len:272 (+) Transcript_141417:260-1075(+)